MTPPRDRWAIPRRAFLENVGLGFGSAALSALFQRDARANSAAPRPHFAPRAKAVIYLHMAGSPSQIDLFDPKPALVKWNEKPCPQSFLDGKRFAFIRGVPNLLASPFRFRRCGDSGMELSELWKHLPNVADQLTLVRSLTTEQFNHSPAQLLLQTGQPEFGGAAFGAWASYGLGRIAEDLPAFVVLSSGGKAPDAGKSVWGSGYLPSVHQGVQCRSHGEPVLFATDPKGLDRKGRRATLDALRALNEKTLARTGDPETATRIAQYELAFRMQAAVPEVMDLRKETEETLALYGARPGHVSNLEGAGDPRPITQGDDPTLANNCLLARRLVERGVRFVQLYDWGWDHHGVSPGEDIDHHLPLKVQQIDRAVTGLILDLERRGLLDSTLVVFGGEFGRTPMRQNAGAQWMGRDHHPHAFSMFLAGGGVKRGYVHGATDEFGYEVVENEVTVRDLQATLLHLLGLDAWRLTYSFQGLDQRWIGAEGKARVVTEILA
jgi:Protein of unknown function (DUF1501)